MSFLFPGPCIKVNFEIRLGKIYRTSFHHTTHTGIEYTLEGDFTDHPSLPGLIEMWLLEYAAKKDPKTLLPLHSHNVTPFVRSVNEEIQKIPFGQTYSYSDLAFFLENPKACRAVGSACGCNYFPLIIPCHRVLGKNLSLGGFSCGLDFKKELLRFETGLIF